MDEISSGVRSKIKIPRSETILIWGGGSNSIFVCRFCEHFAKKRGWTDINEHGMMVNYINKSRVSAGQVKSLTTEKRRKCWENGLGYVPRFEVCHQRIEENLLQSSTSQYLWKGVG